MRSKTNRTERGGFTLVELMVVIAVVGILIGLMLPAIQASREAARKAECQNHLRQLATAMQSHHSTYGRFPTGGWGFVWVGDPDRGTDKRQPGGWAYNILPYLEQVRLRDSGKGQSTAAKEMLAGTLAQQPLRVFNCPTRRSTRLYPYLGTIPLRNSVEVAEAAKTDYAVNAGDVSIGGPGPVTLKEGDSRGYDWGNVRKATGVCYKRSEVTVGGILDGTTHTYLIGEKRCNTEIMDRGDDQHLFVGHGLDAARYATMEWTPLQDGVEEGTRRFGSAHTAGCYFAFADGSVALISYEIDPQVHRRHGNRRDGEIVP